MKLDWTERRIKQFIGRQKTYETTAEKIGQLNERKLGSHIRPHTLKTQDQLSGYIEVISSTPEKALKRLRRRQLEEQKFLEKGYTSAIYEAIEGIVYEVREYIPAYSKFAHEISPKATAEEIERLDSLVQKLHKYRQLEETGEFEVDLADMYIQQIKEEIYDLLLEIQGR